MMVYSVKILSGLTCISLLLFCCALKDFSIPDLHWHAKNSNLSDNVKCDWIFLENAQNQKFILGILVNDKWDEIEVCVTRASANQIEALYILDLLNTLHGLPILVITTSEMDPCWLPNVARPSGFLFPNGLKINFREFTFVKDGLVDSLEVTGNLQLVSSKSYRFERCDFLYVGLKGRWERTSNDGDNPTK